MNMVKRKVGDDNRQFKKCWEEKYFCVNNAQGTVLCLLCNEILAVCKEYSIKRHNGSKHACKFDNLIGD